MSDLRPCGSVAAYRRHLRRHEPPCEPCRTAVAAYERVRHEADADDPWRQLLDLIAAECRRKGYLPARFRRAGRNTQVTRKSSTEERNDR